MGTINSIPAAQKYIALCAQGRMKVVREQSTLKTTYYVVPQSPGYGGEMIVHGRYAWLFADFLAEHGAGDGLLPGFHQTSR